VKARAGLAIGIALAAAAVSAETPRPVIADPDPWPILFRVEPRTAPLDGLVAATCRDEPGIAETIAAGGSRSAGRHERIAAFEALQAAAHEAATPRTRGCAALEAGRLALALGRHPEAAAEAGESQRVAEEIGEEGLRAAARFVRAEALWHAGRVEESRALFEELAHAPAPLLSAAARLRLADVQMERGDLAGARAGYAALFAPDSPLVVDSGPWALRAAEAAIQAGEPVEATRLLELALASRITPSQRIDALIRRADLLAASGRAREAEETLARVEALDPEGPAARFVSVRRAAHALARGERDGETLARAIAPALASPDEHLSAYARSVEVQRLLAIGEPRAAFERLVPLLSDPWAVASLALPATLDRTLAALVSGAGGSCESILALVDGSRGLVLRHASAAAPLAALGDCYQTVGLVDAAFEVLRQTTERFGPEASALPLARASLRAGRDDVVTSAALDRVVAGAPDAAAWAVVLAEAQLARGEREQAAGLLRPIVAAGAGLETARAVELFARAARTGADALVLADAITAVDDAEWRREGDRLAVAALGAADLLRRDAHSGKARDLYVLAAERLPPGDRRAQALYWQGRLAPSDAAARASFAVAAGEGGIWSELARHRLALLEHGRAGARDAKGS
jgi:tetratricopeptide (TPR) repeat protein